MSYLLSFTYSPPSSFTLQDSSSGNTSDVESQEGGGGQGHKSKAKDRMSTGKDGNPRHSASHKATPGYKVEDKTTWTLLQQQQQHFSTPPPLSTTTTPLLHPSRHPSLAFFTLFSGFYSLPAFQLGQPAPHRHTHADTHWGSCLQFLFLWLPRGFFPPCLYRLWAIRTF